MVQCYYHVEETGIPARYVIIPVWLIVVLIYFFEFFFLIYNLWVGAKKMCRALYDSKFTFLRNDKFP